MNNSPRLNNVPLNFQHLVNRVLLDQKIYKKYPEGTKENDLFKRRLERHKNDIINYIIEHNGIGN